MLNKIELKNPITINGKLVKEITYDADEITAILYAEADAKKRVAAGKNMAIAPVVEFDFALHLYMGLAAAIAVNPEYTFEDMERIKGVDNIAFANVGQRFLLKSDTSEENSSDEASGDTVKPTSQASQTSAENE